ncbi:hypothetical protein [Pseudoalteromonas tetraodonis]|nr:hypothetical protein [Pseudoalteromonas tetraodonis]
MRELSVKEIKQVNGGILGFIRAAWRARKALSVAALPASEGMTGDSSNP